MSPKLRANALWCLSSKHLSAKADTSVALAYTKRQLPGMYSVTAALVHSLQPFQFTFCRNKEKHTCQGTLLEGYNLYNNFLILII